VRVRMTNRRFREGLSKKISISLDPPWGGRGDGVRGGQMRVWRDTKWGSKMAKNGVDFGRKWGQFWVDFGRKWGQFWVILGLLEGVENVDFGRFCEFLRIICAPGVRPQYPPGDIGTPLRGRGQGPAGGRGRTGLEGREELGGWGHSRHS
jgi:hypothetical protein